MSKIKWLFFVSFPQCSQVSLTLRIFREDLLSFLSFLSLGNGTWGTPRLFPPSTAKYPKPENIKKPDETWDQEGCHDTSTPKDCRALKLKYDPNVEARSHAMFYCDKPLNWTDIDTLGGVKIDITNRCHFFCEKVQK